MKTPTRGVIVAARAVALTLACLWLAPVGAQTGKKLTDSSITDASSFSGPEIFYCIQGGADKRCTFSLMATYLVDQVFGCTGGDCSALTAASGDSLDMTSGTSSIPWTVGATATPTGEGVAKWDSDDDRLAVGDGAATQIFYPGTPATTLDLIGSTRGSVLYRGPSAWSALAPGTSGYTLTSSGAGADPSWTARPASHQVSLGRSAPQVIATNSRTAVTYDTEIKDTDGFHSTVSNTDRITIPSGLDGDYIFGCSGGFDTNATGERAVYVDVNGTDVTNTMLPAVSANNTARIGTPMSPPTALVAGDYIQCIVFQKSGGNLNWDSTAVLSHFWAMKVN